MKDIIHAPGAKPTMKPESRMLSSPQGLVINRLRTFLGDPGAILDALDNQSHSGSDQLIERRRQVAEDLGAHASDTVKATLMALFCRVEIRFDRVDITLSRCRLAELLAGSIDLNIEYHGLPNPPGDMLRLTVQVGLKRVRLRNANAGRKCP
jgi:hypothetical protein